MAEVFHLGLTGELVGGARLAIVPGDPGRVERIARLRDDPRFLASNREFTSYRGIAAGDAVVDLALPPASCPPGGGVIEEEPSRVGRVMDSIPPGTRIVRA